MKIVSWNCRGGCTEKKYKKIQELDADIYVIQEYNYSRTTNEDYDNFMSNSRELMYYENNNTGYNRGICIIAKEGITLEDNNWYLDSSNDFLSVRVEDSFDLVGVWTHPPYIQNTLEYLTQYETVLRNSDNLLMCGDFNINIGTGNKKNKSEFTTILEKYGYTSMYHYYKNEELGNESTVTFYGEQGPVHIDFLFSTPAFITSFELGDKEDYIGPKKTDKSDHVPLIFEVDL